jgi:hypothetical protein
VRVQAEFRHVLAEVGGASCVTDLVSFPMKTSAARASTSQSKRERARYLAVDLAVTPDLLSLGAGKQGKEWRATPDEYEHYTYAVALRSAGGSASL